MPPRLSPATVQSFASTHCSLYHASSTSASRLYTTCLHSHKRRPHGRPKRLPLQSPILTSRLGKQVRCTMHRHASVLSMKRHSAHSMHPPQPWHPRTRTKYLELARMPALRKLRRFISRSVCLRILQSESHAYCHS